jgi:heme exporter protein D
MFDFQFDSFRDFVAMGGYGVFVWGSYLAFFAVVVWSWWQPRQERKRIVRLLRARKERQQPRQTADVDSAPQQSAQQQQATPRN